MRISYCHRGNFNEMKWKYKLEWNDISHNEDKTKKEERTLTRTHSHTHNGWSKMKKSAGSGSSSDGVYGNSIIFSMWIWNVQVLFLFLFLFLATQPYPPRPARFSHWNGSLNGRHTVKFIYTFILYTITDIHIYCWVNCLPVVPKSKSAFKLTRASVTQKKRTGNKIINKHSFVSYARYQ